MQKKPLSFILRFQNIGTVVVLTLLILISACKKDSLIKTGVQPVEDNLSVNQIDTFTVVASSYMLDSVRTDGVEIGIFGYNEDAVFGTSKASFVYQVKPSGDGFTFVSTNDLVIDSVIFSIQPDACFGNTSQPNSFSLYEITDELVLEDNYYSFQTFNTAPIPLSTENFDNIVYVDTLERYQTIDFNLDASFGLSLLDAVNNFTDNATFWQTFKGFTIVANNGSFVDDLLIHSDIYSINTKLRVYYKQNASPTLQETYDFIIDNQCERINLFENNYSTGTISGTFNDSSIGEEELYLQDMSGIGVNISIPHLYNLYQGSAIVINKAELVIPVNTEVTTDLPQHVEVILGAYNKDSVIVNTVDGWSESHFSGIVQEDEFIFNITRDLQLKYNEYIMGNDINFGYSLLSLSPEQNTGSSILRGTNPSNATTKMKFVLTYSLAK